MVLVQGNDRHDLHVIFSTSVLIRYTELANLMDISAFYLLMRIFAFRYQVMSAGTHELKGKSVEVKTAAPRDGPRPFNGGGGGYNGGGGGYGGGGGGGYGGGGYGGQQGWSQQVC